MSEMIKYVLHDNKLHYTELDTPPLEDGTVLFKESDVIKLLEEMRDEAVIISHIDKLKENK